MADFDEELYERVRRAEEAAKASGVFKTRAVESTTYAKVLTAGRLIAWPGHWCLMTYTCERCRERLMLTPANTFMQKPRCVECGHITDVGKTGCGFQFIVRGKISAAEADAFFEKVKQEAGIS